MLNNGNCLNYSKSGLLDKIDISRFAKMPRFYVAIFLTFLFPLGTALRVEESRISETFHPERATSVGSSRHPCIPIRENPTKG